MRVQHDFHDKIISTQHIHLDHDNCLEIVIVKGKPKEVETLSDKLKTVKGVKHGSLTMASTGRNI
jgi:CopG family nickel-responsive transcriptional regulator